MNPRQNHVFYHYRKMRLTVETSQFTAEVKRKNESNSPKYISLIITTSMHCYPKLFEFDPFSQRELLKEHCLT